MNTKFLKERLEARFLGYKFSVHIFDIPSRSLPDIGFRIWHKKGYDTFMYTGILYKIIGIDLVMYEIQEYVDKLDEVEL